MAEKAIHSLHDAEADWLMDQGFQLHADPAKGTTSSLVMGRIKQVRAAQPGNADPVEFHSFQRKCTLNFRPQ